MMGGPVRMLKVPGYQGRANDIVYLEPLVRDKSAEHSVVVFFGGDVQVGHFLLINIIMN